MPIEYKTYGCKFKCGFRHTSKLSKIEEHEIVCWYNPENKTCKTCKYEVYYTDLYGEQKWKVRSCMINSIDEFWHRVKYIEPNTRCKDWVNKKGDS